MQFRNCPAQSENSHFLGEVGILTLHSAIPELLVREVGIGTK